MSIQVLKQYIDLCEKYSIEPTLSGANRFKKSLSIMNQLSEEDLHSVIFDLVALL
ncbi:hypothetical protein [Clostridium tertium]|mgnify:FL=1|uniref:hypothetical protein n=1 Tax=Clostridium tertium TaxID=1559 RepID=UPI0015D4BB8B|nr:hypothetical protein [Clostridium tertium]